MRKSVAVLFSGNCTMAMMHYYQLGTDVLSMSSFDLHLVELSTNSEFNVKSTTNVTMSLDLV
jgi:hypothetical protein